MQTSLPTVTIPPEILTYGFEDGLKRLSDAGRFMSAYKPNTCDVNLATNYVRAARAAFASKNYDAARRLAYGTVGTVGNCHDTDRYAVASGDGMLLFSKSEIRLGMLTAGKNDADSAAADYLGCSQTDKGYSEETQAYCQAKREEAHDIVKNG
ncbi:MAG: hypothetical protein M3N13_10300 [Candidatus Eremiobacteraeota bacterium]|nr:hypothetical protein [Candidatus Eremiobacteraeota bacterium]